MPCFDSDFLHSFIRSIGGLFSRSESLSDTNLTTVHERKAVFKIASFLLIFFALCYSVHRQMLCAWVSPDSYFYSFVMTV